MSLLTSVYCVPTICLLYETYYKYVLLNILRSIIGYSNFLVFFLSLTTTSTAFMHVLLSDHTTQQVSKLESGRTVSLFSPKCSHQLGQNYSIGVKCTVQGHESKINNLSK